MEIHFTTHVFKEGRTYVAHTAQLDVSSCGGGKQKALENLQEAVRLFLEEAAKMGTLDQILEESGGQLAGPRSHAGCPGRIRKRKARPQAEARPQAGVPT